eukprot:CAMPEP_0177739610 /NCGR_PEP_ID=MMETSP0484_2-20121128/27119_1 /TAXON_ID=354590 /ORGANISM="Rhodomonas lens, Strain RHODO" /LENGTH=182 /DNA_ID=CAMNT_0019253687 /DNA_START=122 /DNA_END=667 /DNA_ORIENTATION=-
MRHCVPRRAAWRSNFTSAAAVGVLVLLLFAARRVWLAFTTSTASSSPIAKLSRGEQMVRSGLWDELTAATSHYPGEKVSGGIFLYKRQTSMLSRLLEEMASEHEQSGRRVQVCETGFGAGHSTALWLASHPLVDVLVFDNFDRAYQRECLEVLEASFPGRVTHVEGDTCKTVPGYQAAQGGF